MWSGTTINDTSSVVAAAYTCGAAAGDYSVVVKLTRTLMIIPDLPGPGLLAGVSSSRRVAADVTTAALAVPWWRMFPWFIVYSWLSWPPTASASSRTAGTPRCRRQDRATVTD